MTDDELVEAIAKVIWDTQVLRKKSTWNKHWFFLGPEGFDKARVHEIAREFLAILRQCSAKPEP